MTEYDRLMSEAAELRLFAEFSRVPDLREHYMEDAEQLEMRARVLKEHSGVSSRLGSGDAQAFTDR